MDFSCKVFLIIHGTEIKKGLKIKNSIVKI